MKSWFVQIADYAAANQLAHEFDPEILRLRLDEFARQYCPVITTLSLTCYWSTMQAEYATDLVFNSPEAVQAFNLSGINVQLLLSPLLDADEH